MTNTTPADLQARMEVLIRGLAKEPDGGEVYDRSASFRSYAVEARAIVAELPKPIDPDVLAIREILRAGLLHDEYLTGSRDDTPSFRRALAAYKRIKADRA